MVDVISSISILQCSICHEIFDKLSERKNHEMTYESNRPCNKRFSRRTNIWYVKNAKRSFNSGSINIIYVQRRKRDEKYPTEISIINYAYLFEVVHIRHKSAISR